MPGLVERRSAILNLLYPGPNTHEEHPPKPSRNKVLGAEAPVELERSHPGGSPVGFALEGDAGHGPGHLADAVHEDVVVPFGEGLPGDLPGDDRGGGPADDEDDGADVVHVVEGREGQDSEHEQGHPVADRQHDERVLQLRLGGNLLIHVEHPANG
mmetsp:Transcript_12789/g.11338  ORF Transcript_12789/g.11338 Transcript_12789/m.11338 type:complete len:156 (+) Transcript_12789:240-707(+)